MLKTSPIGIAKHIASQFYPELPREQLPLLAEIVTRYQYKKNQIILPEGEVCRAIYFIEKGMARQFYFKHDKEVTEHIADESEMLFCIESYMLEEPTKLMIEAICPTIIWTISKAGLERLSSQYVEFSILYRRFYETSLILSQKKADSLRFETAQERYNRLATQHPRILLRAPLQHIASLLQMSPETLSRAKTAALTDHK